MCNVSDIGAGKDEMTKASIDLQDRRRRIYVKAEAEPSWRFWGLYVHVCKMETRVIAFQNRTMSWARYLSSQPAPLSVPRKEPWVVSSCMT